MLEAVYTEHAKTKVLNPFVLLSEVAQAEGVCQKQNKASSNTYNITQGKDAFKGIRMV